MFTGIITKVEKIKTIEQKNQSIFVVVNLPKDWKLQEGESISINGICSTVRQFGASDFEVEYMPETISKTTVTLWKAGLGVNLERSLRLNDFVGGQLVSGHVDAKAEIIDLKTQGTSKVFTIKVSQNLMVYIAPKGSVVLDGVSLTVVDVIDDCFTVSLVSYTLSNTHFGNKKVGDLVNIETDVIAKYVLNVMKYAKKRK